MKLHLATELAQVAVINYLMKMIRFLMQLCRAPLQISAVLHVTIKQSVPQLFPVVRQSVPPLQSLDSSKLIMAAPALRKGLLLINNG